MIDTSQLTIKDAHTALTSGDVSVAELVEAYQDAINAKDADIHAYLELYDDIETYVRRAQTMIDNGNATMLTGIPFALKDNILLKGKTASSASRMLETYTATYTATATQKLIDAGAVVLGRTNMDEFAMGSSTENSAFGPTANPHDYTRVPGGSSGGSAASVSAGMACAALGSDTGGSIRQPAALCGCYGLKPTYGAVSRHGLMAMGSSFDQIGPLARSVEDTESIYAVIRGRDQLDSTTIAADTYPARDLPRTFTVGVPYDVMEEEGLDPRVRERFEQAVHALKESGVEVVDVTLPALTDALATYYVLIPAEISANMARYDGVRYGYHADGEDVLDDYMKTRAAGLGAEVKRRIMIGTYVLSAGYHDEYYTNAQIVRNQIRSAFDTLFNTVDAVLTPTAPSPAFKIGEKTADPLSMYMQDIFTVAANITGMPALSVPMGMVKEEGVELPAGLQVLAAHGQEHILFELAGRYEQAT